ncbi:DUF3631 domain-containing protein [Pseudonocardia sp. ICBG601]|uniref:DUF3631 domain-containing protein n=1 Tax=Pseudonocardia sp. ICBG601 TaxID=2846759 RepID=UPI001CF61323|nr:DUF3631 domain-containing protein [Pseudonocardia sp. ICBG601]
MTRSLPAPLQAEDTGDDRSERIRLLADCHAAFGDEQALPTMRLLQQLRADPEAPWADYGPRGEGLTAMRLGKLLGEYDIRSVQARFPGLGQVKVFRRESFADAWRRYTPDLVTDSENDRQMIVKSIS